MKKQIIAVIISLIMLSSCSDDKKEKFERAKQLNTISVYETFIKENYESTYADSALIRLQGLEFRQAATIEDLENFKRKYTQSIFLDSASAKIHILKFQDLAINKRFTVKRVKELKAYLADHPKGFYAKSIHKTIDSLDKATPPPPPPPPKPLSIQVVEDEYEDVVIESTETTVDEFEEIIVETTESSASTSTSTNKKQDYLACGNCKEAYLKTRTFGGSNELFLDNTMYIFYAFYTPNKRACYGTNEASDRVAKMFENALKKNNYYKQLVNKLKSRNRMTPVLASSLYKINGKIEHKSTNYKENLKEKTKWRQEAIKYIKIDVDFEPIFKSYPVCK